MSFNSPGRFHSSPRQPLSGIESGNSLGQKPVVRQSKLYREKESGNAMKGIFGQDHLSWDTEQQEGVFQGQGVYDAAAEDMTNTEPQQTTRPGASSLQWSRRATPACSKACHIESAVTHCAVSMLASETSAISSLSF